MKKVLLTLALSLAVSFSLQGCGLATMPLNIMVASAMTKSAHQQRADKCATIDTQAGNENVSRIERNRRLTAANCPI